MKKFLSPKNLQNMPKTAVFLPQKADFQDDGNFLFRFELIKTKNKKNRQTFFFNYTVPRAIALGAPRSFG